MRAASVGSRSGRSPPRRARAAARPRPRGRRRSRRTRAPDRGALPPRSRAPRSPGLARGGCHRHTWPPRSHRAGAARGRRARAQPARGDEIRRRRRPAAPARAPVGERLELYCQLLVGADARRDAVRESGRLVVGRGRRGGVQARPPRRAQVLVDRGAGERCVKRSSGPSRPSASSVRRAAVGAVRASNGCSTAAMRGDGERAAHSQHHAPSNRRTESAGQSRMRPTISSANERGAGSSRARRPTPAPAPR